MRFFQSALLAVSALASVALAQSSTLLFTSVPSSVTVGNSYTIGWKTSDTTSVRLPSDLSSESELINRIAHHYYSAQGSLWKPSDHFHFDLYESSLKSVLNNLLTGSDSNRNWHYIHMDSGQELGRRLRLCSSDHPRQPDQLL